MGKVHGSLARAGKVKSQTPKVFTSSLLTSYHAFKPQRYFSDHAPLASQIIVSCFPATVYRSQEILLTVLCDGMIG